MLAKSLFVATLFALTSVTVATPPGCLLGAVNTYPDPSDIKSVCSAKDVSSTIAKYCTGDSTKAALSAFADICNGAGVKVCKYYFFLAVELSLGDIHEDVRQVESSGG